MTVQTQANVTTPRFLINLDAPLPAGETLVRIPLAVTGQWVRGGQRFSITRRDLEEIARNFQDRLNGEINVDYDHASEMPEVAAGGPIPSAGRIVKLDPPEALDAGNSLLGNKSPSLQSLAPSSRSILWGWYEPTTRARELIQNREYRYISPAIDWTARNKRSGRAQGATLTSVALTNRPFLEELPEIRLSDVAASNEKENGNWKRDNGSAPCEPPASTFEFPFSNFQFPVSSFDFPVSKSGGFMKHATLSVADGNIKIVHEDLRDDYVLNAEEVKKCLAGLAQLADSESAVPGPRPPAGIAPSARPEEITVAQAAALLSENEARGKYVPAAAFFRAQVERELEEAVRAGKILPRQRDDWRKIALSDFTTFRKIVSEQKPQVPLRPAGFAGAPPEDVREHVRLLVEQRCRERKVSFGQALGEIGREHPDLVREYRRSVSSTE